MLRTALTYLLAVMLSLNGFLVPVAMARHQAMESPSAAEVTQAPHTACHGEATIPVDSGATTSHEAQAPDQSATPHGPSCCTKAHCVCGCFFATALTSLATGPVFGMQFDHLTELSTPQHASTRHTVPLRPPIA
ncbi:MAG: CopL family metal-binding regulatory protein [Rhodanobacteraceae bacterium]|nr:CopL family metal-binding regulatory protein [Rhodanobacteraceae bacterium]